MPSKLDWDIIVFLAVIFIGIGVNFSPQLLGVIYVLMIFLYLHAKESRMIPDLPFVKYKKQILKIVGFSIIAVIFWLLLSQFGMNFFGNANAENLGSVIRILATNTSPPYITENPYLYFLVFGVFIPIAETLFFFGVVMPWLMEKFKFGYETKSKWILAIVTIGIISSLFHYTSHIYSNEALIADFVFFALSGVIVLYYRDLVLATTVHFLANSLIILSQLKVI